MDKFIFNEDLSLKETGSGLVSSPLFTLDCSKKLLPPLRKEVVLCS